MTLRALTSAVFVACAHGSPATAATASVAVIDKVSVSDSTITAGAWITTKITLENAGSVPSARKAVVLRLANSERVRTIVYSALPAIGPSSRATITKVVRVPVTVPAAKYHFQACSVHRQGLWCVQQTDLKVQAPPAALAITPTSVNFGSVVDGASSSARRFVVHNLGNGPSGDVELSVGGSNDEHFKVVADTCSRSLGPGASCFVDAAFRPRDDGELTAVLKADPDRGPPASARLTGIGRGDDENDGKDETGGENAPAPCGVRTSAAATSPGSIVNLTNWKLTLPTDGCDADKWADEVTQPQLASFRHPSAFFVNSAQTGVVFRARVDGARTSLNTKYPRSELREMTARGEERASWSNTSGKGTHSLTIEAAITNTPAAKPEVVAAQIHDADDDVIMIRLYGRRLVVDANDSRVQLPLDENYVLGTRFKVVVTASSGNIRVTYNNSRIVDYTRSGDGMYFKAGCYTLSNTDFDSSTEYGEVVLYKLAVTHS